MKSSLKVSVAALGLVASVLVSAAAASAADKVAAVDVIVDYSVEDAVIMAGQNEYFEQIETESYDENEINNDFEITLVEGDEDLRPTDTPESKPSSSKPASSQSSSAPSSSQAQTSSKENNSSDKTTSASVSSSIASSEKENTSSSPAVKGEYLKFRANGYVYNLPVKEALKKVVSNELDGNFDYEAIKAQIVATHTYIKYYNDRNQIASVGMKSSYVVGGKIDRAVEEVYNIVMTYNGKTIFSPYFASAAGRTNSSREVWGGTLAYLTSVESKYDYLADYYNLGKGTYSKTKMHNRYLATKTLSEDYVKQKIEAFGGSCSGKPKTWFKFLSEEKGGYTEGGYVNKIIVGGKTTTGKDIRSLFGLRSAAFKVTYKNGNFIFTTEGYGHGAGMSQWGAHFYADKENWSYKKILKHYYTGISFKKVS